MFLCLMFLGMFGDGGAGLISIAAFILWWIYPVFFEVMWNGQTPGKKAVGLMVVNQNGTPVGWQGSLVRNLMRAVDMLPLCYGFGLTCSLFQREGKRLGDLVAGTLVIYAESASAASQAVYLEPLAPQRQFRAEERAAVIRFAERFLMISAERQNELASIVESYFPNDSSAQQSAVTRILRVANHYLGRAKEQDVIHYGTQLNRNQPPPLHTQGRGAGPTLPPAMSPFQTARSSVDQRRQDPNQPPPPPSST
jgi:uncharacterized RDD family membrane protein YckC